MSPNSGEDQTARCVRVGIVYFLENALWKLSLYWSALIMYS